MESSISPERSAHCHSLDPGWITLTWCRVAGQIFDLSMQRHESLQTTNTQPTPSNRHEEGSDRKEKSDSLQLGLIAYRFLYFEANTRIFCVHLIQIDASRKVCSLSEPHPRCSSTNIS
jgi:hypothetical protein